MPSSGSQGSSFLTRALLDETYAVGDRGVDDEGDGRRGRRRPLRRIVAEADDRVSPTTASAVLAQPRVVSNRRIGVRALSLLASDPTANLPVRGANGKFLL